MPSPGLNGSGLCPGKGTLPLQQSDGTPHPAQYLCLQEACLTLLCSHFEDTLCVPGLAQGPWWLLWPNSLLPTVEMETTTSRDVRAPEAVRLAEAQLVLRPPKPSMALAIKPM